MTMVIILGLLAAAPGQPAPRWTAAGMDAAGRTIEIDRNSLDWRSLQRAWWRIRHAEPKRDGTIEERHLELVDCRDGVSAPIQTMMLGQGGQIIADQRDGEELALQRLGPPTPDSAGETVAIEVCRLRPPPPRPTRPPPRRR